MIGTLLALAKGLPWWVYAGAAMLAWGAVQRHQAVAETRRAERAKTEAVQAQLDAALTQSARLQEVANAATARTQVRQANRRAADAAGSGLRVAALEAARPASAAGRCEAAETAARVLADLLGSVEAEGRRMAEIADERRDAGLLCEQVSAP